MLMSLLLNLEKIFKSFKFKEWYLCHKKISKPKLLECILAKRDLPEG